MRKQLRKDDVSVGAQRENWERFNTSAASHFLVDRILLPFARENLPVRWMPHVRGVKTISDSAKRELRDKCELSVSGRKRVIRFEFGWDIKK